MVTRATRAPGARRRRALRAGAWAIAGLLWLVVAAFSVETSGGERWTYIVGFLVAQLSITLALGLAVRWVYVRARKTPRRVWVPWVLLIAAWFSLPQVAVRGVQELERYGTTGALLARLPASYDYSRLAPDEERIRLDSFGREGVRPRDSIVREVSRDGRPLGEVVVLAFDQPAPLDELARGFEEAGGKTRRTRIDGAAAVVGTVPEGTAVAFRTRVDRVFFAFAPRPSQAGEILALASAE